MHWLILLLLFKFPDIGSYGYDLREISVYIMTDHDEFDPGVANQARQECLALEGCAP